MLSASRPIRVVAVDDHFLTLEGIKSILQRSVFIEVVGVGRSGEDIFKLVEALNPDVMVLDVEMPADSNDPNSSFQLMNALPMLTQRFPNTKYLIVSQYVTHSLLECAISVGVHGYLLKNDALTLELSDAIKFVFESNETPLKEQNIDASLKRPYISNLIRKKFHATSRGNSLFTQRQMEIIYCILKNPNFTSDEIGDSLALSGATVRNHLSTIFNHLGVKNLNACILELLRKGIVTI